MLNLHVQSQLSISVFNLKVNLNVQFQCSNLNVQSLRMSMIAYINSILY
jgi:hypothetical protein